MDSFIELNIAGTWHTAAALSVSDRRLRFEYLPEYVFGDAPKERVALGLPVSMETISADPSARQTPLAFLWDLVPQGRGRQHLANLLGVPDQDPGQDLYLAQHGAFAPIGRLRFDTAVEFYEQHAARNPARGFTREDMTHRTDQFLDQLTVHSMLAAGTPGVQGVAPKFLLAQDEDARWFPDVALPDARARRHWIVKLPRGREANDMTILRHEAIYLKAAAACGLRAIDAPEFDAGMLFLPRFDRRVEGNTVLRIHQETLASLMGAVGFGRSASLFDVTKRLAEVVTRPGIEVAEFLCRDVMNRVLRNTDNHLRNTSVQQLPDGTVQLTPLYDLAPMYLDHEVITRTCAWNGPDNRVLDDWNEILERLELEDEIKLHAAKALRHLGDVELPRLTEHLRDLGADDRVIGECAPIVEQQIRALSEIDHAIYAPPQP